MFRLCVAILALVLVSDTVRPSATSYELLTFSDLVNQADVIFVGEVIDVRPFSATSRNDRIIKTRVVFRVLDPVWGTTAALEVLEFLGGAVGDVELTVAEMPHFTIGDRRVVFARRDRSINPIVGFTQGLLQIRRDSTGIDRVFTSNGAPIADPDSIGSLTTRPEQRVAMRLVDLRIRVRSALVALRRQ